ncbi:MAG: hypothetical protein JWM95_3875 [Gemmatimonadetes bacterium]|nr:hypothetical protein [Gemmatimonadota bacterium]
MNAGAARTRYAQPTATHFLVTFGYAWCAVALVAGTLVLPATLRMFTPAQHDERLMFAVAGVLVVVSFLLARAMVRALFRQAPTTRNLVLFLLGIPAILCAVLLSDPVRYLGHDRGMIVNRVIQVF